MYASIRTKINIFSNIAHILYICFHNACLKHPGYKMYVIQKAANCREGGRQTFKDLQARAYKCAE